jgi:hypothetical protein
VQRVPSASLWYLLALLVIKYFSLLVLKYLLYIVHLHVQLQEIRSLFKDKRSDLVEAVEGLITSSICIYILVPRVQVQDLDSALIEP